MDAISLKVESRDMDLPHRGFIYPEKNVATMAEGARVIEGECVWFENLCVFFAVCFLLFDFCVVLLF